MSAPFIFGPNGPIDINNPGAGAMQEDALGNVTKGTLPLTLGGTGATAQAQALTNLLPSQTGLAGFVVGTNGTLASWVQPGMLTRQLFTSTGTQTGWLFSISAIGSTATVGAVYTNNSNNFTVVTSALAGSTFLFASGTGATTGGTLTLSSGSGPATITFSAKQALATYTTSTLAAAIKVTVVGAGGGGGGCGTAAATAAAAGGGGGGSTAVRYVVAPGATYFYCVGVGGNGGGAGLNNGSLGGTSAFSASNMIALGGGGGGLGSTTAALGWVGGIGSPGLASNGDLNIAGSSGGPGYVYTVSQAWTGFGGSSSFAPPTAGTNFNTGSAVSTPGTTGTNYGGGGAGGGQVNNGATAGGGPGANGLILVEEF
jgi:hypothetical protein